MRAQGPRQFVSIGTKLSAFIVALLAIVFTYVYVESTERARHDLIEAKWHAASMVADLFAASLIAPLDFGDTDAAQTELGRMAPNPDVIYAAVWATGIETPFAVLLTEGRGAITGMPASREPRTDVLGDRVEAVRHIVGPKGQTLGGLVIHFSLARENATYDDRRRRLLVLSASLTIVLSVLLIGLGRRMILSPLSRLAVAARRMEWGTEARVEVTSDDEIGRLGGAFNAMAAAIVDRERWLAAARSSLQEVLDNMRQAIVVFGREGLIEGAASRQAGVIFGRAASEGHPIKELLYPGAEPHDIEALAFDEWLTLAFDTETGGWEELSELAPREVTMRGRSEEETTLELEFRPVIEGARVARVMLLATDVTAERRLERAVQSHERQHARQMAAMRRLIASGAQLFVSFLHGVKERLARCRAILGTTPRSLEMTAIDEIFQHVHTIKSEARSFDLGVLADEAAGIENRLAEVCGLARQGARLSVYEQDLQIELRERLERAEESIETARTLFVEASPIGAAVLDQITVSRSALLTLSQIVAARRKAVPSAPLDDLASAVNALAARPFGESTAQLIDAVPAWASSMGKQAELEVIGREVLVPPELARALSGVLTHLARNAVAHGIEPPEERTKLNKPQVGRIRAACAETPSASVKITIEDDGRGLDLDALREQAGELGIEVPAGGPAELVFRQGVSTAGSVSDIAGRGVGLAAVRAELAQIGWHIEVSSSPSRGTLFVVTRGKSRLPPKAV